MPLLQQGDLFAHRFEIDRPVGAGGMGTVYRARDQHSGDFVALKLLHGNTPGADDSERFVLEAQILAELQHPGIVGYVAHGQTQDGQRFLAMQWLDGEDLSSRLKRGPLSLSDALMLTRRVAEALALAHRRGIIHRDLKPTNLFLPRGEIAEVRILDFGIARRVASSRAMTRTGMILGTPEYMAPEQARGVRQLTPAADFFSLGCVLYECLAGDPPFVADHIAAVLVRILFEEPVPITARRPGIPAAVSRVLGRLLAKEPDQRLGDADQLIAALAAVDQATDSVVSLTLPTGTRITPPHRDSEQALLSLVLALSANETDASDSTVLPGSVPIRADRRDTLLSELRAMGAQADLLISGALVATVPQMASAKDQATLAARCAAKVKELWPDAQVAVVTARGSRDRGGLSGEVLDRAWHLFGKSAVAVTGSASLIRIDEVSAGLLESRFELAALAAPSGVYTLGAERPDPDAGRLLLGKPTPCVGRERELLMLEAIFNECREESLARVVLVLAPPGLGKSRLRHEFVRRLEAQGRRQTVLLGRGDPMKVKSTYGLLGEALRQWFEVRTGQSLDAQRALIRQWIGAAVPAADAARVAAFIGELCGVPFLDEESPQLRAARQDPRIMSDQVERAWLDCLTLFPPESPLLLVLEDLHWSDALTVKLIDVALRRLRDHAFMVLALARPEVQENYPNLWSGFAQQLLVHPISRKAGERLVRQVLGGELPAEELTRIVEQSAGNPLFLEELIRAAADRKPGDLPETMAAMIQARIGRLPVSNRRALRAGSVFGETFWENGVRTLLAATHPEDDLHGALADLGREEIIEKTTERRFTNEPQYRFRHALVRDAAYGLVNAEEQAAWHFMAGHFLAAMGERDPVVLAEHFVRGPQPGEAIPYLLLAGQAALNGNDLVAALDHSRRALECGASGEMRGALCSMQAMAYFWRSELRPAQAAGLEALALLPRGSPRWCQAMLSLFLVTIYLDEHARFQALVGDMYTVEPAPEAVPGYMEAASILITMASLRGDAETARAFLNRISELGADRLPADSTARCWVCYAHGIYAHWIENNLWLKQALARDALVAAERSGDRRMRCITLASLGFAQLGLGDYSAGQDSYRAAQAGAKHLQGENTMLGNITGMLTLGLTESREPHLLAEAVVAAQTCIAALPAGVPIAGIAQVSLARVAATGGDLAAAELYARQGLAALQREPATCPLGHAILTRILLQRGDVAAARQCAEEGLRRLAALGCAYGEEDLYAALALVLRADGDAAAADAALFEAERRLLASADFITDPAARTRFLYRVPLHAEILQQATERRTAAGLAL
ncbi:MAG TPA: protein kinase [Pseudomonadota bacterium]|nr:protein kinase [Pseudomonadota bacterium]